MEYSLTPVYDEKSWKMFQDGADVPDYIVAAAKQLPQFDASESLIFARQLETIKNRLYEKKYPELKGESLVPMSAEHGLEAQTLTMRVWEGFTLAMLVSDYGTDFPLVTSSATEMHVSFHEFGNSYGYNMLELRRCAAAGVELTAKDAMLARRGHAQAFDDAIAYGVPAKRTFGLVNHPNVPLITLPNGDWGNVARTGVQILADLNHLVTTMWNTTLEIWQGDTMVVTTLAYRKLATTLLDEANGSNITVLQAFKAQNPEVSITSWTRLTNANAAGTNGRVLFYKKSEEVMEFEVGRYFEVFPPEQRGLMVTYPCLSRFAGLQVHYPHAISYADNQLM
jgi:hypothetical protein